MVCGGRTAHTLTSHVTSRRLSGGLIFEHAYIHAYASVCLSTRRLAGVSEARNVLLFHAIPVWPYSTRTSGTMQAAAHTTEPVKAEGVPRVSRPSGANHTHAVPEASLSTHRLVS